MLRIANQQAILSRSAKRLRPYQWFVNRSDLRGGSIIGSITSAIIPISTVDIGNPIWGMHSIRETSGVKDVYYLDQVLKVFFSI